MLEGSEHRACLQRSDCFLSQISGRLLMVTGKVGATVVCALLSSESEAAGKAPRAFRKKASLIGPELVLISF